MSWYHAFPEWSCLWPTLEKLDMDAVVGTGPCDRCNKFRDDINTLKRQAEIDAVRMINMQGEIDSLREEKQAAEAKLLNADMCGIYRREGFDTSSMGS